MRSVPERRLFAACFFLILTGLIFITTGKVYVFAVTGLFLLGAGLSYGFPVMLGFVGSRFADLSGTAFSIALVIALVGNMSVNYAMGFIAKIYGIRHLTTVAFAELMIMIMLAAAIFVKLKDHKQ
jgi:fucose permease